MGTPRTAATALTATERDPRWAAVVARDHGADGRFCYAVRTTGVYCRPSCPARRAKPSNVVFFATPAAAEAAGFRACRRCAPKGPPPRAQRSAAVVRACRAIEAADEMPTTAALARHAGLSVHHFHRLFKSVTGLTPKMYAEAHRAGRLRAALPASRTVTAAAFDAGFNAASRFYEKSARILGMRPSDYRAGGVNAQIRFALGRCSLGAVLVARSGTGICAIALGDDPVALERDLRARFPNATVAAGDAGFTAAVGAVVALVEEPAVGLALPLDIRGTAFQERVWRALCAIPAGETTTYTALARTIGAPKAVRAVAGACAANTLAVAVPCHRVVRSDGTLSGYRWGVARKRALLAREAEKGKM